MGRRSRKRSGEPAGTRTAPPPPEASSATPPTPPPAPRRAVAPPSRRARLAEAPQAPWSPFPLVELTIFIGLVLMVLGFFDVAGRRGPLLICGFALVTLSGLELSLREHFAGYRSHSSLLAGAAAVIVVLPLYLLVELPQPLLLGIGVAIFAALFLVLRSAFRRRSGGIGFRV